MEDKADILTRRYAMMARRDTSDVIPLRNINVSLFSPLFLIFFFKNRHRLIDRYRNSISETHLS